MTENTNYRMIALSCMAALGGILLQGCAGPGATSTTPALQEFRLAAAPPASAAPPVAARATAPVPAATVLLPAGTTLRVRLGSTLSTKVNHAGESFTATLASPLIVDGRQVAGVGSEATGIVTSSDDGGRVKGRASLGVRLTSISTANGETIPVRTAPVVRLAPASKKKDALKIGIGSGIGAAIGAIAGGGRGAAIGAGAGAGAGTGVVLATHGSPAVLPTEALLTFRTSEPVQVPLQ
jgi:hypothetical protein